MNSKGRCIKGKGLTHPGFEFKNIMENLASHLRNKLGTDVLIPCAGFFSTQNPPYCEVCFKNDPGKIFCPGKTDSLPVDYGNRSVYEDRISRRCAPYGDTLPYWTGYDDGSICDCGTPFFVEEREGGGYSFRPLKNGESRPGFVEGPSYVDEDTGVSLLALHGGHTANEMWEEGETALGVWDSRPPDVAPKSCSKHPDITSIYSYSAIYKESIRGFQLTKDC